MRFFIFSGWNQPGWGAGSLRSWSVRYGLSIYFARGLDWTGDRESTYRLLWHYWRQHTFYNSKKEVREKHHGRTTKKNISDVVTAG